MPLPTRPAQDAHDAFGMNTHFGFQGEEDTNRFVGPTVDLLLDLGVGRIRQKLYCDANRSRRATREGVQRVMAAGVRVLAPTLTIDDATDPGTAAARMAAYLDEIEGNPEVYDVGLLAALPGLNEPNGGRQAPPDWARRTRVAQQAIFEQARSRPAFAGVPVQGPPLARLGAVAQRRRGLDGAAGRAGGGRAGGGGGEVAFAQVLAADATAVGDVSGWADRADLHIYPGDQDSAHGGPVQAFVQATAGLYARPRPVTISEYGWANTTPDDPDGAAYTGGAKSCPETVTARYAPKAPLNALVAGFDAVYAYEMLENQPPYADTGRAMREAKFGYVRTPRLDPASWEPKLQFHAMKRYLAIFADPGPAFTPQPLAAEVRSTAPDLRALAFQRRDGTHLLALWRPVDLYRCDRRSNAGEYLQVSPEPVTVTLDRARATDACRPSSTDRPQPLGSQASVTVDVCDELVVLRFA